MKKRLTPIQAIRKFCLECEDGSFGVKKCVMKDCPLYCYRLGTNPSRKGIGNKEAIPPKKDNVS